MMGTLRRRLIQRQQKLKRETLPQNEREMMRDLCATIVAHTFANPAAVLLFFSSQPEVISCDEEVFLSWIEKNKEIG